MRNLSLAAKAIVLALSRGDYPVPYGGGTLALLGAHEFVGFEARDLQVEVDAIEQGSGDLARILDALSRRGDALLFRQPFEPARTRVHRADEHAAGWECEAGLYAGDCHNAVFQRMAQSLEHVPLEFGHLSEEYTIAPE